MKSIDLVSVIIPVYNVEKYVTETLDSVVDQSYSNIEIIIINDGSTDRSLEIVRSYEKKDDRIKVIDKKNEGLGKAREKGINESKGSYFVTIDSDDVLDKDYIKELYTAIIDSEADIALCARKTFDGTDEEVLLLDNNIVSPIEINHEILENKYNYLAATYQMSDSWNKMYKKNFVMNSGVHFILPREYNGTDLLFNYSLLLHEPKIVTVNKPLYLYRLTQNSRVRRKNKHLEKGFKYILECLLEENKKLTGSKKIENQIFAAYISMIKYATQDLAEEIKYLKTNEKIKCFKDLLTNVPIIQKSRMNDIYRASSKELKIFAILLFMRTARGIFGYYKIREYWRQ